MAASDAGALIAAAAIGAGGAVSAQIISSIVTSRRDTQRFNWERERQDRDWRMQREERFHDAKQDLYRDIQLIASKLLHHAYSMASPSQQEAPVPEMPDLAELQRLQATMDIICPREVAQRVEIAILVMVGASYRITKTSNPIPPELIQELDDARDSWHAARQAMSNDLYGVDTEEGDSKARILSQWRHPIKRIKARTEPTIRRKTDLGS